MAPILNDRRIPALESARTLVSLAVGHGAQDNVSVAVISVPPKREPVLLLVLVVGSIALAVTLSQPPPRPTAVPLPTKTPAPVEGGLATVGQATAATVMTDGQEEQLVPGKDLVSPVEVWTGSEGQLQLLLTDGSRVFLAQESGLRVEEIDFPGREEQTRLRLLSGELLLHRPGGGDRVTVFSATDEVQAVLAPPVAGIYIKVGTAWMRSRRARPILAAGLLQPTTQQPAKLGHHAAGMFILPQASNDRVHSAGLLPYDCLFRTTVLQFAGAKIAASAAIRFKRSQT